MKIGEYIRNKAFKIIDSLAKDPIHKYVSELQNFEKNGYDYNVLKKKLDAFLYRAQSASSFYRGSKFGFDLSKYPVIIKSFLMNNADQFQSEAHVKKNLVRVSTSGSYGTPFTFYLTREKKKRQKAEVIHYGLNAGYEVGLEHVYFRTVLAKSRFKLWLQNETFISCKVLGNDFLQNTRIKIKRKKPKVLKGFPSAIAMLAQFCIEQGDSPTDFSLSGVITYAENLTNKQRDIIYDAFGCKVISRYGTEELGILGCQIDNENGFKLNACNYIIEVLKLNDNVSVLPGEMGRVVITDINSDAFPLIRYETGDLAILGDVFKENAGWAKSLRMLSGRSIQTLNATNGDVLYPLYFENVIERLDFFTQFQLIQETKQEYTLKLVPKQVVNLKNFSEVELIKELHDWLGNDARIDLQLVKDIEMLPSGKRPSFINRLKT